MATLSHCNSPACKLCSPSQSPSSQTETLLANSQSLKKSSTPTTPQTTKSFGYKNTTMTITPPHLSFSTYSTPEKKPSPYHTPKSSEKYGPSNIPNNGFYDVLPPPRSPFTIIEPESETTLTPKITNKQTTPKSTTPISNKFVFPTEDETVDTPSKVAQSLPTKVQGGFEIQDYGSFLETENNSNETSFSETTPPSHLGSSTNSLTHTTSQPAQLTLSGNALTKLVIEDTLDLLVDYEQAEKERVSFEVQKHMEILTEKYKKITEDVQREEQSKNQEYDQRLKQMEQDIKVARQRQQTELGELIQTLERNSLSQKVETNRRVNEIIDNDRKLIESRLKEEQENRERVEREQERLRNEEKHRNEERLRNEEKQKNEEKLKLQNTTPERGSSSTKSESSLYVSERALAEYQQVMNRYTPFENALRELENTPAYSVFRRNHYKRINTMILQIAADVEQCRSKINELNHVLNEVRRDPTPPQIDGLPVAYIYCLDQISSKFLSQAKSQVSAFQPTALPLAYVATELCKIHTVLLDFMLAHFYQIPYTLPRYLTKGEGEPEDSYMKRLGYQENPQNPNGFETQQAYWERTTGIIAFFSAFMQTPSRTPHPFGLERAWTYLSRLLNLKPRKIAPILLLTFLEIAGYEFSKRYPTQLRKIFQYIITKWMPLIPKDAACLPALSRLEVYINNYLRSGRLSPPEGYISV